MADEPIDLDKDKEKRKKPLHMYFILAVFIIGFGIIGLMILFLLVAFVHDAIWSEKVCDTEQLVLDDVAYMDNGKLIFVFGDNKIIDVSRESEYVVGNLYRVERCYFENKWINNDDIINVLEVK